jgi:protease-4
VLGLVVRLVLLLGWLLALPWLLLRRFWPIGRGVFVLLEIDGPVVEVAPEQRFWQLAMPRAVSLRAMARLVDEIVADDRVRGLLVLHSSMRGGMATAQSLRALYARVRAAKKEIVVALPQGGGSKDVYAAMEADKTYAAPQAVLASVGFLVAARYLRGALDRAGLVPQVLAAGKYKSAGEQLARESMSDAQREQIGAVLDGLHRELVGAIARGRKVDDDKARAIVDGAPYVGTEAESAGLVDGVAYEDEMPSRLAVAGRRPNVVYANRYFASRRALDMRALRRAGVIAIVRVHGPIAPAMPFALGAIAVDQRVIAAVRMARASPVVRGVVLHVDSPGGSALSSDRIHHELVQLAAEKPLVACFGDVAAT